VYTDTDEAPALATYSLLPIIKRFAAPCNVKLDSSDISLAGRILSHFPENIPVSKRVSDHLAELGALTLEDSANIIKLPNVSASIPQLQEAIAELQSQGYNVPSFPRNPTTPEEIAVRAQYSKVLGSAVNPVLREGNSDRRVAGPVKSFAQSYPHRMMKPYLPTCKAHVSHMESGDFFGSEKSAIMPSACTVSIQFMDSNGQVSVLKNSLDLEKGEVVDASVMSAKAICEFYEKEFQDAKKQNLLLSLHLKATMMKVSDPIMFGYAVKVYYKDVFEKHAALFERLQVDVNNGLGDVYEKIKNIPEREQVEKDIMAVYKTRPSLAMVDSSKGITNLHVPSDVIIDASMPNVVRDGGKMWNADDKLQEVKCLIPDRSYAGIYKETLDFCKANGAFDPATMGNVANAGLMAKQAEEYGSHDKTFEMKSNGKVLVKKSSGEVVFEHAVESGDIWRMCQCKDDAIEDWVKLAVSRARATGSKTIFWLNPARGHDASLLTKVKKYLPKFKPEGLDITIMTPEDAIVESMKRAKAGLDTISVTGNVLRDYLTDLFPILELGTSAKMLSIVPLLKGGGLYETGAGGSAPKHVQQFLKENHLRWDSLGEFLALTVSLEDLGIKTSNSKAKVLADALTEAVTGVLENKRSPSRKAKEIDNRGSHFYLALYWAQALAKQPTDMELQAHFKPLAEELEKNEEIISKELIDCQGEPVDIGGYFHPDPVKTSAAMRPSKTFNEIIDKY